MNAIEEKIRSFILSLEVDSNSNHTPLCVTMKKFGSDKCSDWHNYTPLYALLVGHLVDQPVSVFELGIFKGSSVRGWKEYFRSGDIFAADVDSSYFVNDDRIRSFFCDQDNIESIRSLWRNPELSTKKFDLIIDDGKHEFQSNLNFLVESHKMLKPGGIFVIEDLTSSTWERFELCINELKKSTEMSEMFLIDIPNRSNKIDNKWLIGVKSQ